MGETVLLASDLVAPFFVLPEGREQEPIASLPGVCRLSIDDTLRQAEQLHRQGVLGAALFPVIAREEKDSLGQAALKENGLLLRTIQRLKREIPSLCLITDVALDPYTSHGHDGLLDSKGEEVLNDATVEVLCQMALLQAQAGADFVAPSDMMDGRVGAIRKTLDSHGHEQTGIVAYSIKYASSLYAPFREALGSTLSRGDKKGYQMNPSNVREALLEAHLDEVEGADVLMVKPALFYLDIIAKLRAATHLPICAYHVSGEYAMVMAAERAGMLDAEQVFLESLLSIKRAGADFIISYAVPQIISSLR